LNDLVGVLWKRRSEVERLAEEVIEEEDKECGGECCEYDLQPYNQVVRGTATMLIFCCRNRL